ncbi:MAG: helix-turn-helix transcriptional regulator [Salinivirgaceae bacterium]|jgi:AraC family transcriptional activator of pobA|nr:helix-turn-helix transcriptional regulator [Salinivirgaceae bacterium]
MHTEIKTYSLTDTHGLLVDFKLQTMEQIEERMADAVDSPHRHDYYTIILVKEGRGKHFVDFQEFDITDNSVYFIYPGQVHQVIPVGEPKGWVITFTNEFLVKNNISDQLINDVYLFNNFGESPPLSLHDHEVEVYESLIRQIGEFEGNTAYNNEAKGSLLKLFLIKSHTLCSLSKNVELQSTESINPIFRAFKKYIDTYFSSKHKVSDYAELLSVSSDYLNKVVKSLTGKSAKEYIQNRIMIEAKRSLLFTDLSNKELSYHLGFEEPAHFSNFFKKNSGSSAIDFRIAARNN